MKVLNKKSLLALIFILHISTINLFSTDKHELESPPSSCIFHPCESSEFEEYQFTLPENPELFKDSLHRYFSRLPSRPGVEKALDEFIDLTDKLYSTHEKQCPLGMKHNIENVYAYLSQQDDTEACVESIRRLIDQHQIIITQHSKTTNSPQSVQHNPKKTWGYFLSKLRPWQS
jgi:hypothetical protein